MHKRCREIMDELILSGELEEITWFKFAPKQELKLRLKDMLDDEVDEKYLLNQTNINFMNTIWGNDTRWRKMKNPIDGCAGTICATHSKGLPRGVIINDKDIQEQIYKEGTIKLEQVATLNIKGNESIKGIYSDNGLCPSLTTMQGGHREPKVAIANGLIEVDTEVRVKEATKLGYKVAEEGDSINISVPSSKTRRGRVGKQVAQTLDTACNQVVFNNKFIFRKLTERECFRLQGFDDSFIFPKETKSLYFQFVYDKINEKEIKWNVRSKVVKEKQKQLNTETYVFCTTKEWQDMEQLLKTKIEAMQDLKEKMQDVCIVMKKSEEVEQKECATNTIKWTDCIKTLFLEIAEKDCQEAEVILEEDMESQSIGQSWKIQLGENLTKEKLYITLILLKQIIISKTYMYAKVHQNTQKFIFSLKSLSKECLKMELSYLKMEYTKELISSSQLYKQAGNGMSRNILDMIFTQIFTCYAKHIEKQNSYARGGYTENAEKYIGKIVQGQYVKKELL